MKKKMIITIAVIVLLWLIVGIFDYFRVSGFEKPFFCISKPSVYSGAEDYQYCQGLGYSFEIVVNSPQSEYQGITRYTYFIFGNEVTSGIRD